MTQNRSIPCRASRSLCGILAAMLIVACESGPVDTDPGSENAPGSHTDLVWAVNIGGPAYTGRDGTAYVAEESIAGGRTASLAAVEGSQDDFLYQSYRTGAIGIRRPLADGTYDLTFHFAEPGDAAALERVFDVIVEGETRIDDLDVLIARDGRKYAALTVTVPDVVVTDGELNIDFEVSAGEPVLSALVVRPKSTRQQSWELIWSDEFATSGRVDPDKWSFDEWPPRVVNSEDQAYTARSKNVRVEGGNLIIEAHREDFGDARYTSGRIHSRGKGDFLYGRIEARARMPRGMGTWAAIWMLPSDPFRYATNCEEGVQWQGNRNCDAWPNSGEIDIVEHVGYLMDHVHGTVHNRAHFFGRWNQHKGRILGEGVADDWHVYALEWSPERIDIFFDDSLYFTYVNEGRGWQTWPYDAPFHLVLNLAIGGDWGRAGGGIDDAILPQRMVVDYVRVYRQAN